MSSKIIQRSIPDSVEFDGDLHPVLHRVFLARNISDKDELDYSLKKLINWEK